MNPLHAVLQVLSILAALFAAGIVRSDRRWIRRLQETRAFSLESAVDLPHEGAFMRWRLRRLVEAGAIGMAPDRTRLFLSEQGWMAFRRRRRMKLFLMLLAFLAVAAAVTIQGG